MRGEIAGHGLELVAIGAIWIGIGWYARRWLRRREGEGE
jgi:hypothetical protein